MICQVCKEDHRTIVNKEWCDRSLLEIENDYLKTENARLRLDLSDAEMRKEDSARLLFLIENEYVVKAGIDRYWLAEPDETTRIGGKYITPIEAIDKYRKEHP
jgi:hypothetical protein